MFLPVSREDMQASLQSGIVARLQVAHLIAHNPGSLQVEIEQPPCSQQHTRPRLACGMRRMHPTPDALAMIRTRKHRVDRGPRLRQLPGQRILGFDKLLPPEISAADARLVGDFDHRYAFAIGRRDDLGRFRDENHIGGARKIAGILDDDAVAIQQQRPASRSERMPRDPDPRTDLFMKTTLLHGILSQLYHVIK